MKVHTVYDPKYNLLVIPREKSSWDGPDEPNMVTILPPTALRDHRPITCELEEMGGPLGEIRARYWKASGDEVLVLVLAQSTGELVEWTYSDSGWEPA